MVCRYVTEIMGGDKYVSCSVVLPALLLPQILTLPIQVHLNKFEYRGRVHLFQ